MPAEIGHAVGDRLLQAIHGPREHERERIFPRPLRARKNDRMRHTVVREHLAQAMDGFRITGKIRKGRCRLFAVRCSLFAFSPLSEYESRTTNSKLHYSFSFFRTNSIITAWVSPGVPRAFTMCTRCGSRWAIAR